MENNMVILTKEQIKIAFEVWSERYKNEPDDWDLESDGMSSSEKYGDKAGEFFFNLCKELF
jgi:hypothetical protein